MRRSRPALLLFLGTFIGSLVAVGLADGGHQPIARPADIYRMNLDLLADDGNSPFAQQGAASDAPAAAAGFSDAAALGNMERWWIALPTPTAPMMLLVLDGRSVQTLTTQIAEQDLSAARLFADALATGGTLGCIIGPWVDDRFAAIEPSSTDDVPADIDDSCEALPIDSFAGAVEQLRQFDLDAGILDAGIQVAAKWVLPLHAVLIGQVECSAPEAQELSFDACDGFPDASIAGWLDESSLFGAAHVWHSIGQMLRQVADQYYDGQSRIIAAASRGLVDMLLTQPDESASEAEPPASPDEPRPWPSVRQASGSFLTL